MTTKKSQLEQLFNFQLKAPGFINYCSEYPVSRDVVGNQRGVRERLKKSGLNDWRLDFAWPDHKLGIEIQGGTWSKKSAHSSGVGIQRDCTKSQQCAGMGWQVVPVTGDDVRKGRAIAFILKMFDQGKITK